jgi:transcription termination factor Rho
MHPMQPRVAGPQGYGSPQQNGQVSHRPAPARVLDVDGLPLDIPADAKRFDELTSIDPQPRLTLEYPGCPASCRLIDLFCPIGRGQRGLIVSPPKAGKTTLLKDIATAILRNHPDVEVVVLLVDERPEEVTDFRRTFVSPAASGGAVGAAALAAEMLAHGEGPKLIQEANAGAGPVTPPKQRCRVIASSNDNPVERHLEISINTIDRCKRMVEAGKHIVVLLDSLTRMGRAFNQSRKHASSGRTLTGGLDSKALEVPRQLFGSARNTEESGSLTIVASCLVDTGSQADQVIFEEFKGSGNMELILDRKISERRLFPAINLAESGTRKEQLLLTEQELKTMTALRRRLLAMPPHLQVEQLLAALKRFPTNAALVGSNQAG